MIINILILLISNDLFDNLNNSSIDLGNENLKKIFFPFQIVFMDHYEKSKIFHNAIKIVVGNSSTFINNPKFINPFVPSNAII